MFLIECKQSFEVNVFAVNIFCSISYKRVNTYYSKIKFKVSNISWYKKKYIVEHLG